MNIIEKENLKELYGGTTLTGTRFNVVVDLIKILYDSGKSTGEAIRRLVDGSLCPLK